MGVAFGFELKTCRVSPKNSHHGVWFSLALAKKASILDNHFIDDHHAIDQAVYYRSRPNYGGVGWDFFRTNDDTDYLCLVA